MAPLNNGQTEMTGPPSGRFDDDRLLAYALQIGDDAELEQALAADAALRERLLAMRADLGVVEDQLRAAVPAPAESWADLSAARWDGLRPYVSTRPAPVLHRRRFSLRVLAPAVGVVAAAALAVGLVLSQTGGVSSTSSTSAESTTSSSGSAQVAAGNSGGTKTYSLPSPAVAAADANAAAYQTAVVARAGAVNGGVQDFTVVRTLKGSADNTVRLSVEVGGALKQGALALLLLTPTNKLATPAPSAVPAPSSPTPSASATDSTRAATHLYLYKGTTAVVQELPAGTDPSSLTLP
jgi:hypothetical protein